MTRGLTAALLAASGIGAFATVTAAAPPARAAALTHEPLVMRLSKDEFRIAFGIAAPACADSGCSGVIRYRIEWQTEDGTLITDIKRVGFSLPPHSARTITVDRQYFDTAEGAHTTRVVRVTVERISCAPGAGALAAQLASLNERACTLSCGGRGRER